MRKTSTKESPFPDSVSIPVARALFMLDLSVLDQSPVRSGGTPAQALAETVQLAQAADSLGYRRYWLAEHHGTDGFAGSAPEVLITRVAAATSHIRVGAGGVMLAHYSPLKVAENFRVLENLYPGRIDLGIGRAPGSESDHRPRPGLRVPDRNRVFPLADRRPDRLSGGFESGHRSLREGEGHAQSPLGA